MDLCVVKSRKAFSPCAGPYFVINPYVNGLVSSEYGMDIEDLDRFLQERS